ncbi:serine hydrolase [uncultured Erythrobacter sp.]|uniref:serine hydrolase domain-containing protein n=1 Tax=uncultured Erythrobacter sp. TaxID=263913 RepID=UPI00265865BE|nr:serine hydrolase [uncultured Erythrobacter sp.]
MNPSALDALFAGQDFAAAPGCVAALLDGDVVAWQGCFGLARLDTTAILTPATRMRIASITKPMVALTLAALEDEGKLALTDPLSRHVPEHRFEADPTLAQMLAMKSGIPETYPLVWLALGDAARLAEHSQALLALLLAQRQLNFLPGERTLYANANTVLLHLVTERATGEPLARLMQRHVFDPAGMVSAVLDDSLAHRLPETAIGYARSGERFVPADPVSVEAAPGGVIASLADMIAWHRWLRGNPRGWRTRLAGAVPHNDGSSSGYAHGFVRQSLSGVQVIGHAGGHSGWASDYLYAPDKDVAVIILANRADANVYERAREMLVTALGVPPDPGATPALTSSAPEPVWEATYASVEAIASLSVKGGPGEIAVDGRRMPRGKDGVFRRTLGVEPFVIEGPNTATPPAELTRWEGNHAVNYRRVDDAATLPAEAIIGTYACASLPHPVTIKADSCGVLRVFTGPVWPGGEGWPLVPVCGALFRCTMPDGAPSEVHLRFEADADGPVTHVSFGFLRLLRITLARIKPPVAEQWRDLGLAAPKLLAGDAP